MNKKILMLCIVLMLCIPSILGGINIDDIKVYINNERIDGIDEDGGDIELEKDDVLEFTIIIDNTENTTSQAKISAALEDIDDGDDIVKNQDWYNIDADDDRSKTLSFHIPSDANIDMYDLDMDITTKLNNGTEKKITIKYDVEVISSETEEDSIFNLKNSFSNMTGICTSITSGLKTCMGYINKSDSCNNELSTVKEERGTFKSNYDNCNSNLATARNDKIEEENEKLKFKSQVSTMIGLDECNVKVTSAKKEKDNLMMMLVGGMVVLYVVQNKKKKNKTVQDAYHYKMK